MKRYVLMFFFLAVIINLFAQNQVENAIKTLENKRFEAQVKKDAVTLNDILADDLVYIHSNGSVENKTEYIKSTTGGKTDYRKIETDEVNVRVYENTAVVTGLARMVLMIEGKETPLKMRYTDIYVKRNNKWQMVSWSAARLPIQ